MSWYSLQPPRLKLVRLNWAIAVLVVMIFTSTTSASLEVGNLATDHAAACG